MKRNLLAVLLTVQFLVAQAQEKVNFSPKFKIENQGKYKIEVHELKELIQIMIALTKSGKENDDMIQQQGQYYKDLIAYFKPYENEQIIKTFDSLIVASPYNYIFLTGNAISYDFKGNSLIKSSVYDFPATAVAGIKITENPITKYKKEIEDFTKKSNFRYFYNAHKKYYKQLITDYNQYANLGKQWKWLEDNFETRINSYLIFCSALINGLNYTDEFKNNDFRLIYMSLPPLDKLPTFSALQNEIFNTRMMFTEIDHNYVGPPSKSNKNLINELFKERSTWVNEKVYGVFAYANPISVFDEYMTYGVFLLYCKEQYDPATFDKVYQETVKLMSERGFPSMKKFTDQLLKTKAEHPQKKIDNLYLDFLKHFECQS